jgi:hypothetical protein
VAKAMSTRGTGRKASETPKPDLKLVSGAGKNSTLSDVEQQALFFQHKKKYEVALSAKKLADAALLNVGKLAKAELGEHAVADIKESLKLGSPEGQADLKERMERQYRVARWMGMPLGSQSDLFGPDRRTGGEIAHSLGFEHGSAGESRKLPDRYAASSPEGQAYFKGWDQGQEAIFNIKEKKGDDLLRPIADAKPGPIPRTPEPDGDDGDDESGDAEEGDDTSVH